MKLRVRLPELRMSGGRRMTIKEVSKQTNISEATLGKLDRGESTRLDFNTVVELCRVFKVKPGELFELVFEEGDERFNDLALVAAS